MLPQMYAKNVVLQRIIGSICLFRWLLNYKPYFRGVNILIYRYLCIIKIYYKSRNICNNNLHINCELLAMLNLIKS